MAINWKQGKEVIDLARKKHLFFGEVRTFVMLILHEGLYIYRYTFFMFQYTFIGSVWGGPAAHLCQVHVQVTTPHSLPNGLHVFPGNMEPLVSNLRPDQTRTQWQYPGYHKAGERRFMCTECSSRPYQEARTSWRWDAGLGHVSDTVGLPRVQSDARNHPGPWESNRHR